MRTVRQNYLILASIYAACMAWVWSGVFLESAQGRGSLLFIHAAAFTSLLAVTYAAARGIQPLPWRLPEMELPANLIFVACIGFVLFHWVELGGIPALKALASSDYLNIAKLRQSITEHGPLLNYGSIFLIRVLFPLLVLRHVLKRQYRAALLVGLVAVSYGLSLMQKSFPILVVAPAMVYLAFRQRQAAVICAIVAFLSVVALVLITNVQMRTAQFSDVSSALRTATVIVTSLGERLLLVPGQVVSDWLNAFPTPFPFEHGCGYRFVSSILGCDFINNSVLMYRHYFPDNVSQGLLGTYNAAHFAEEYANFGPPGLVLSAVLANVVLFAAAWVTSDRDTATIVAIHFPFIASLSSSALQTTLVSGGWFAIVALSLILLPEVEADARPSIDPSRASYLRKM